MTRQVIATRDEFVNLLQARKDALETLVNFDGLDFRHYTFQFGDFTNLDLSGCNFDESVFTVRADFSGSTLTDSSFEKSNFEAGIAIDLADAASTEERYQSS